jgi:hypothetical protein
MRKHNQHAFISFAFDIFVFLAPETKSLLQRVQKVMNNNVVSPKTMNVKIISFTIQKGLAVCCPFFFSFIWNYHIFINIHKTSSKTASLGVHVRNLLPFGSLLGLPLTVLVHQFLMSIYMICSSQSKTCFPRKIPKLTVSTLSSLCWSLKLSTTLPSGSMIPSKTPLFGPTTKAALTQLKAAITGYSPWGTQYILIILYTLGLGYGNFNFRKISNFSFGWLVTILCLPFLYLITVKWVLLPLALVVASTMNHSFIAFGIASSLVAFETTLVLKI